MPARRPPGPWLLLCVLGACANVTATPGADGGTGGSTGMTGTGGSTVDAHVDTSNFDTGLPPPPPDAGCDGGDCTGCGNGVLNPPGETCDDGNKTGGDGCTADCKVEKDWICEVPGQPCTYTVACGDGKVGGTETCDDRNKTSGDGCSADCQIETGWTCPAQGARCLPMCGDGVRTGIEGCDDGNTDSGDGCSETCRVEPGYACPMDGMPCHKSVCGDKVKEGAESCDDGNLIGGDGCSADCRSEPVCVGTNGCTSPCGDGLKLPSEECDDGNVASGDGCSSTCKLEMNWDCKDVGDAEDGHLVVPVILRDFMNRGVTNGHPNFEQGVSPGVITGMVKPTLATDRKPVMVDPPPANSQLTTAADFNAWYHDGPMAKTVNDTFTLDMQPDGTFVYDHSEQWDNTAMAWTKPPFFPLDGRGWALPPDGPEMNYLGSCDNDHLPHNYSFTSEIHYWFEYQGGETLQFIGDDDVWVFVNGQLAVDLGGVHGASPGMVTLDAAGATKFGLTMGQIYEIAVFQAERHMCGSSYKLTLGKFNMKRTVCTPKCGDGVVNGSELCDDGKNDGSYGGCTPDCKLAPYCGDAKVDADHEECDDGKNVSTYGQDGCGPACHKVAKCGDGNIDSAWGEQCDDGNNVNLDGCTADCKLEIL